MRAFTTRGLVWVATVVTCFASLHQGATTLTAEENLRWNLQAGQEFNVTWSQEMVAQQELFGTEMTSTVEMILDSHWEVTEVDDDGVSTLVMDITRVRMNLASPQQDHIAIDTDEEANGESNPQTADIETGLHELVESQITQKIDARGNVVSVEFSGEDGALEESSFASLLSQPIVVLPESAINVGDSWEHSRDVTTELGEMSVAATYTLAEIVEHQGMPCAKILVSQEVELSTNDLGIEMSIESQETTGIIYFAQDEGRVVSTETDQNLEISANFQGQSMAQQMTTQVQVTIEPAGQE